MSTEEAYKSSLSPWLQTPGSVYYLCHWPSSASPSLLHYKTFLLYLSPVSHNYSLISTRWLHWQLGLTLPITDINSFLALLDINILWIWICHSIMRIKTGWRNREETPQTKCYHLLSFHFRPEELLCRWCRVLGRCWFKGSRPSPCSLFCHWTVCNPAIKQEQNRYSNISCWPGALQEKQSNKGWRTFFYCTPYYFW